MRRWQMFGVKQWEAVEPGSRGAHRADNRGRPWHDTRSVLNVVFSVLGTLFEIWHRSSRSGHQRKAGKPLKMRRGNLHE